MVEQTYLVDLKRVSIIIVNWNGRKFLEDCLKSVYNQTYSNYEVIVVDNGSFDGSVEYLKKNFPNVRVIALKRNYGFARANNIGFRVAKGEYILLLNNDVFLLRDSLEKMIKVMEAKKDVGVLQPKIIILSSKKLDNCGSFFTNFGWPYHYGLYENPDDPRYNVEVPVCAAYGAFMLIRREVIEKMGLFDEDFFMYGEELDFCYRAWIAGYKVYYWPCTTVYHVKGGTVAKVGKGSPPPILLYHQYKNRLCSYLKNLSSKQLLKTLPTFILGLFVLFLIYFIRKKQEYARAIVSAILWNLRNVKYTFYKRKYIQDRRIMSDEDILRIVKKNPPLSYYLKLLR
jgi:GT2 family glycosyltransferase